MTEPSSSKQPSSTRREFLKTSTAATVGASAAAGLGSLPNAHAAGSDLIKVGLIGCGGRGRGEADQSVKAAPNVQLSAVGDTFQDHIDQAR
jgi:hypothetical protein